EDRRGDLAEQAVGLRVVVVFFFSSRRRHTRLQGDWSSDVCSSDLWRSSERRPTPVGSRLSSLRLTRSSWSAWGAGLRRCRIADCSTPSTATSDQDTWRV